MKKSWAYFILGLLFCLNESYAGGQNLNFIVNSSMDEIDAVADGTCKTSMATGELCTLRAALMEANQNTAGTTDISFDINDTGCNNGACVIQVDFSNLGALPDITERVNIDGSTQPDNDVCSSPIATRSAYGIVIQGQSTDIGLRLELGSDGSVIRGLNIRNFVNNIAVIKSADNRIECNFIGTDETGLLSAGSNASNGIIIGCESNNNIIGGPLPSDGNVIGGHAGDGIQYFADFVCPTATNFPSNNAILGNYIGVGKDGITPINNTFSGISFFGGATYGHSIGSLQDGITFNPNVIGNNLSGIYIADGSHDISITGNFIGTDLTGTVDMGHIFGGIEIDSGSNNQIGGEVMGEANIITNNDSGVLITADDSEGNVIGANVFKANAGQPIEIIIDGSLDADGLNSNDVDDADIGANQLMNHPEIQSINLVDLMGDLGLEIEYTVNADTNNAVYPLKIDAYYNDQPGLIKQAIYTDTNSYTTAQQNTTSVFDLPDNIMGGEIRLVATDAEGNTSELSTPADFGLIDLIYKNGFE